MGRFSGPLPFGRKNITKSEWNDFITWQKSRNNDRIKTKLVETDLYNSSGDLSPETWESLLNETSCNNSNDISPIINDEITPISLDINKNADLNIESNYKKHKPDVNPHNKLDEINKDSDSDDDYGPMPLDHNISSLNESQSEIESINTNKTSLKGAGMTPEEIKKYESLGYVMSGSSYWKLSQAKLKERESTNEDKKANVILTQQERASRENELIDNLKAMLKKQNEILDKSSCKL